MQVPYSVKTTKETILEKLTERRTAKTTDTSRSGSNNRGDSMLQLVRQDVSNLEIQKFNDMTDFDIQTTPGEVWEELNNFNCDYFDS